MQESTLAEIAQEMLEDIPEFGCLSATQVKALLSMYQGEMPVTKASRKSFVSWATTSPVQEIFRSCN